MSQTEMLTRITAALRALAVGDALGRATEHYTPEEILEVYEDIITDFVQPVRLFDEEQWRVGEIGPPTTIVLEAAEHGGVWPGATGANVAHLPAGVAAGLSQPLPSLMNEIHGDGPLAAVAAGTAAAVDGYPFIEIVAAASRAARLAGDDDLAEAILQAGGLGQASGGRLAGAVLRGRFPSDDGSRSVVPLVFGIVYALQSARRAIIDAVNQGGHAPETAAIAGAICAAAAPVTLPPSWWEVVERANPDLDLEQVARLFAALRGRDPHLI